MEYDKIIIMILVAFCAITMAKVSKAETYPQCKMYEPYRCVPIKGNAIRCGCGL